MNLIKYLFIVILPIWLASCLDDPEIKIGFETYLPDQLNDGWEVSTPGQEGFDVRMIDSIYLKLFDENQYPTARGLLIVRHGKLVAEGYCKDRSDRESIHALQSATKSITSIVTGIAIDQGLITSMHTDIYAFIPEYFDADLKKREITIYHALTMQTGLSFVNDDHTKELFTNKGSSLKYVLHKSLRFDPGTSFYYNDGDPQLISGIIQATTGMSLEAYARQHLFMPLGIDDYLWESHADGLNFGAAGLWLIPRDMAKIGKLMVQNGKWESQQIVSEEWVEESTAIHANTNYGYYWWNFGWEKVFMAIGRGEQVIFIDQPKNTVVVLITDSFSDANLSPGIRDLVYGVMAAIID